MTLQKIRDTLKNNGYELIEHFGWGVYEIAHTEDELDRVMCEDLDEVENYIIDYML